MLRSDSNRGGHLASSSRGSNTGPRRSLVARSFYDSRHGALVSTAGPNTKGRAAPSVRGDIPREELSKSFPLQSITRLDRAAGIDFLIGLNVASSLSSRVDDHFRRHDQIA
jgi:hypothetical protein